MKTFTLQDLQNKKYLFVDENNEPLKNNDGEEISNVREYIRVMAQRISQRRKDNADSVKAAKLTIDKKAAEAINNIEAIRTNIPSMVEARHFTQSEGDCIIQACKTVCDNIIDYQNNINILYDRISHGKIRISSVGLHRQGKTIFTRLFTGLGPDILPSHTGATDTTGTLVVLNHVKDNTETSYTVSFYTKDEILKTVNDYIKNIRSKRNGWTIRGKAEITSIEELRSLRGCDNEIENLNSDLKADEAVKIDYIDGLAPYFRYPSPGEIDWIDCLTEKEEEAKRLDSVNDINKYILMNESRERASEDPEIIKKTLYLAVRAVHINVPFNRNGDLFDLIEIVDTKGGGTTAGSHVNDEIKKAIDMSDAVFSLHKTTTTEYNFYDELSKLYGLKSGLQEKHFVIINKVVMRDKNNKVEKNNDVNTAKENLAKYNQAEISYCGDLCDDDALSFANYIIADMLYHIAKYVNKFDNDRIIKCNKLVDTINKEVTNLCSALDNPYQSFDESTAVRENITKMIDKAKEYIRNQIEIGNQEDTPDDSPEYSDLKAKNELVNTLYWLITGNDNVSSESSKVIEDEKKVYKEMYNEPDDVECELISAVFDVFPKVKPKKHANEEHVGRYIESCVNGLDRYISLRFNNLTTQEKIGIKEKNEIFNELWSILKLDQCYASDKNWKNCNIDGENKFFSELLSIFKEEIHSTGDNTQKTLYAYKILKTYFKYAKDFEDITPPVYVNDSELRAIIAHSFYELGLDRTIVNMSTKDKRTRADIAKKVDNCLKGDEQIAVLCESFYSYHKNNILSGDDLREIELSERWQIISNAKKVLNEAFMTLPLLS